MEGDPTTRTLRVSASFGARFELCSLETDADFRVPARTKGKKIRPVAGDLVQAKSLPGESDWLIQSITPRSAELDRTDTRGRREILAANVSTMVVVLCGQPEPDYFIADRYLAAAELMPCRALVVWNKADQQPADTEFEVYRDIGYDTLQTSAETGAGIDPLRALMRDELSILVGQSGVGKSSLINALSGSDLQQTGMVSASNHEGRHTTVAARLLTLSESVSVIDSPGVRDYAPGIIDAARVRQGFREIWSIGQQCRFADCHHRAEPGCAVKAAVENGDLNERRYRSYLRLAQINRQLRPAH